MKNYLLSFDQGTTSSRAIVFNRDGAIVSVAQKEFTQIYPQPGWVEHNATEIWSTQVAVAAEAILNAKLSAEDIAAIGITNQRETTVVWDKRTGEPVCNAIVWQDRRTAEYCDSLKEQGYAQKIQEKTGLLIDAYFYSSKYDDFIARRLLKYAGYLKMLRAHGILPTRATLLSVLLIPGLYGSLPAVKYI